MTFLMLKQRKLVSSFFFFLLEEKSDGMSRDFVGLEISSVEAFKYFFRLCTLSNQEQTFNINSLLFETN